jgi:hypothetical protein
MMLVGFIVLNRRLPKLLHPYVTRKILEDVTIVKFDPGAPPDG